MSNPKSQIPIPKLSYLPILGFGIWALGFCVGCSEPRAESTRGELIVAIQSAPNNLDPRIGTDEISQRVSQLVFSYLMSLDEQLRVVPVLAERLENPDPVTYIVRLRRGVSFHDGHELTSKDVVYTFTSLMAPEFISPRKGAYRLVESITALDDYSVQFKLKEPFGSFPVQLVLPIVPDGAGPELRAYPIGTGPYRFVRYDVDDRVVLTAFEGYYDGLPNNPGVVLKVIPDDTMRGLELRKGTVDLVINDINPDIAYQLQQDEHLNVVTGPGTDYQYIGFNMRDALLADKRVRHAIAHAIDRQAIVDYLRRGQARPAVGLLPPVSWAFEASVRDFPQDPARARQLLDEAGHPDPDGDGPLPRFTLSLKISTNEFSRLQATVLQQNLRQIGIDVDVRSYEFATLYADVLKGNFQMFTLQWVGGAVADPDILRRVFHSAQVPPTGFNRGYYSNPEVDRALDIAQRSTDEAERKRLYAIAQRLIAEDAPYVSLWNKTNVAVMQDGISGLRLMPTADFTVLKDVRKETFRLKPEATSYHP
jgi:peptide/nickel transport system substrate-binding protein